MKKVIILFLFLYACSSTQEWIEQFGEPITAKSELLEIDSLKLMNPQRMAFKNSKLILLDFNDGYFLTISDFKGKRVESRFARKGNGPSEMQGLFQLNDFNDKEFSILDVTGRNVFYYNWDNLLTPYRMCKLDMEEGVAFSHVTLKDNGIFFSGLFTGTDHQFGEINCLTKEKHFFLFYPTFETLDQVLLPDKAMALQNQLFFQPDKERIAVAYFRTGMIQILEVQNGIPKILKENRYYDGQFINDKASSEGVHSIRMHKESVAGFGQSTTTKENIYLLYTGKKYGIDLQSTMYGNTILVLDWDGNPIKRYLLDCEISCFAVEGNTLVAIKVNRDFEPSLVQFDLE
jgi:hypothetical protein